MVRQNRPVLFYKDTDFHRDAKGVEFEQEGEKDKIAEVSAQFNRFQMMNFNEHHHCLRGTHLKTQGVSSDPRNKSTVLTGTVRCRQVYRP